MRRRKIVVASAGMSSAKLIGLKIPQALLLRADEVIQ